MGVLTHLDPPPHLWFPCSSSHNKETQRSGQVCTEPAVGMVWTAARPQLPQDRSGTHVLGVENTHTVHTWKSMVWRGRWPSSLHSSGLMNKTLLYHTTLYAIIHNYGCYRLYWPLKHVPMVHTFNMDWINMSGALMLRPKSVEVIQHFDWVLRLGIRWSRDS